MKLLSRSEEIVLLAILKLKDNAYGVPIRDLVCRMTGQEWSFGQVYMPLDKLTYKGYVSKTLSEPTSQRGGRSKCMYTLTQKGKDALTEILNVHNSIWAGVQDMAAE